MLSAKTAATDVSSRLCLLHDCHSFPPGLFVVATDFYSCDSVSISCINALEIICMGIASPSVKLMEPCESHQFCNAPLIFCLCFLYTLGMKLVQTRLWKHCRHSSRSILEASISSLPLPTSLPLSFFLIFWKTRSHSVGFASLEYPT